MRCPTCDANPPSDPFICPSCGGRLFAYLGRPFGEDDPGTAPAATLAAPSPGSSRPKERSDHAGLKVLAGLGATLVVLLVTRSAWGAAALAVLMAVVLWRNPLIAWGRYVALLATMAAAIWLVVLLFGGSRTASVARPVAPASPAPAQATATAQRNAEQQQLVRRGTARWHRGDHAGALADLTRAIELNGNVAAYEARARVRLSAGDVDAALADANEAARLGPQAASVAETRGHVYLKRGQPREALADFERAVPMRERAPSAGGAVAFLGRGLARAATGDGDGARADLERGLALQEETVPTPQLDDLEREARRVLATLAHATPAPTGAVAAHDPTGAPAATGRHGSGR